MSREIKSSLGILSLQLGGDAGRKMPALPLENISILCLQNTQAITDDGPFFRDGWTTFANTDGPGLVTLVRHVSNVKKLEYGIGQAKDKNTGHEGLRMLITDHKDFVLFNVQNYSSYKATWPDDIAKTDFELALLNECEAYLFGLKRQVIIVGNLNVIRDEELDTTNASWQPIATAHKHGPWLDIFLGVDRPEDKNGKAGRTNPYEELTAQVVDVYRAFHPLTPAFTFETARMSLSAMQTRCRLDYILVSQQLFRSVVNCLFVLFVIFPHRNRSKSLRSELPERIIVQ